MPRLSLLYVLASISLALAAAHSAIACDPQASNKNPKDVTGLVMSKRATAANLILSADLDRNYDLVDPLDGLTFGFGNWPQQKATEFFADMAKVNGGRALRALEGCLSVFFSATANRAAWSQLETTAKVPIAAPTLEAVAAALKNTVLSTKWMQRYRDHCVRTCRPGEADFYHEQKTWFVDSMHYALADRQVIEWQVDYWDRTIVADAVKMAAASGLPDDEAAIVGYTAYASSSPGWSGPVIAASKSGTFRFENYLWSWKTPPRDAPTDPDGLRRWRRAIIWQYYVERTRREQLRRHPEKPRWEFRGRSIAYYNTYLKAYWILPALSAAGVPIWNDERNLDPALLKPRPPA